MKNFYAAFCKKNASSFYFSIALLIVLMGVAAPGHLFAQAPTISYSSPQTYTINVAVTALLPTSSGVAAISYNTPVSLGSGFSIPTGVAVDASGNTYVADQGNSLVKKMPAGGGTPITVGTGFNHPYGVAADAAGNIYVADEGNNAVKEILASNGSTVTIGSGFSNPSGVAVDAAGNVYVADYGNNAVKKIPTGNGTPVTMGSGFSTPTGVAVDAAGNVYVADYGHSAIKEILISNGSTVTIGSGYNAPAGVAVDASGNLYIADTGNNLVKELPAGGGAQVTIGSGFASPYGVGIDSAGNVYVADENHSAIKEIKPLGGYYISTALPLGLVFNNATGTINGTPTVLSAAKNYTVTAYNSTASANAIVNITVNPPPLPTIHYSSPQVYITSVAITPLVPTTTGTINSLSINPALPAGLSFNNANGTISGTPTGTSAAANYTVTAQNPGGTATAFINITVNNPPRPTINYGGPQTYLANAAIMPLTPTSTWVSAPGYRGIVNLPGSFNQPNGIATDAAGNIYVADGGSGNIIEISADGTTVSTIASGFSLPTGITVNQGYVYVSDWNNGALYKIIPGFGPYVYAGGFNNPGSLASDAAGNIYVSDENNRAVKKIPAGGGSTITLGSGFVFPQGLAVDPSGNVYVAVSDAYNNPMQNAVYKIPAGGGPLSLFLYYSLGSNQYGNPRGLALDGNGNFYMSDILYGYVLKYPPGGGGSAAILASRSQLYYNMAVSNKGILYACHNEDNTIKVFQPSGGYFITPALPPGMHIDGATGTISGTPTVTSPATTYTITGYNVGGATSTTVTIGVNAPPAPTVSYSGPSEYLAGRAIPPLAPASTNVDVQGYNVSTPVDVGSGFNKPAGLGTDLAGNVYVADAANNAVKKIPAGGGTPVIIGSGFSNPYGVTTDAAGNIYIADKGDNAVKKLPAGGGIPQIIGSGFSSPKGVAVDASGNVFVADAGNNAIKKILAAGDAPVTIGGGFNAPAGVAVDGSGNVFVADAGNSAVKEILAVGGSTITLGSGFNHPAGVAVDGSGDVFVADAGNNLVKEIPSGGGAIINMAILGPGFNNPDGITIDAAGNVYVADNGNSVVVKFKPVGGYFISPYLPAGLSINASTGVISGMPMAGAAAATYTVTAWNFTGSASTTLRFSVDPILSPPTLNYGNAQAGIATVPIVPFSPSSANIGNYGYNINYAVPIGSGLVNPVAVAADPQGNIYIADDQAWINGQPGIVYEEPANGSGQQTQSNGLGDPTSLAAAAGNLYISDTGNLEIFEGDLPYSSSPELSYIGPVAADGAGNVYTFNPAFNTLFKLPPDLSSESPFGSGLNSPVGIAADQAGNVYVSDAGNNNIVRFKPDGSGPYTVAPVNNPGAITLDPAGNIYVVDNKGNLFVVFAGTNYTVLIASGLKNASSLAIDGAGNIYWADTGAHLVYKMVPIGGYFLGAPLPNGLIFSNINGSVSGTPAVASPAANYTVTAYNSNASVTATFNLTVNAPPPPPSLSYTGPQTYAVNSAITPLSPVTNNTVAAITYRPFPVSIGSGLVNPVGVAVDSQGNVYVSDDAASVNSTSGRVYMEAANGGGQSILVDGASDPTSVATDAAGDLFISDTGLIQIFEVPAGQSNITAGSPELSAIGPIAVDGAGNVYTFAPGSSTIYKLPSNLSGESPFASGLNSLVAIAADRAGNVYVSDAGNNDIVEFAPNGTGPVKLGTIINPGPLAVDPAGNIYVLDNRGNLYTITVGTNTPVQIGSGFTNASSLAIDGKGNIYYTDRSNHLVKKVNPAGGYFLNMPLPVGLSCPNTIGIISGTPTAINPATNYTVTAYNVTGGAAATVSIAIINISPQTITFNALPAETYGNADFSPGATSNNSGIPVTYSSDNTAAAIIVSGNIHIISAGTANITASQAADASHSAAADVVQLLTVNKAPLTITANNQTMIQGQPVPTLTTGYGGFVNGDNSGSLTTLPSISTTGTSSSPTGMYPITASGAADANYSISYVAGTLNITASANAALSSLTISSGTLSPAFSSGTASYTASVANTISSITVTPGTGNPNATVKINGTVVPSGTASANIPLNVGANTITIIVTAQDGITQQTYTLTVTRAGNPVPAISYAGPQSYIIGTAITPLAPASSGVAAPGYSASAVTISSGFSAPTGVAADAAGDIYVADYGHKLVKKISAGGGAPVALGSGFVGPYGVAVDALGNVYVADYGVNAVKEIPVGGGATVTLGSGFLTPTSVAVDGLGNVYVADYGNNAVKEIPAGGGAILVLGSGFIHPEGVAVDALGDVYVADYGNAAVKKISAGGGTPVTLGSGFVGPHGVAIDASDNVFVADYGNNTVKEIPAGGGALVSLGAGFNHPAGIATDGSGNVYAADLSNNAIKQIKPVGGYYISALPAGLSFDNGTGIISGTPTVSGPATNYTVTAYNSFGRQAVAVNITINTSLLPIISYAGPQTYTAGSTITALAPIGSSVAAPAFSTSPVTLGSGFSSPTSVAIDAAGNVYVADEGHKLIKEIPAGGGTPVTLGSGFNLPYGVSADGAGNVYVADYSGNAIKKIPVGGGSPVTLGSGFLTPTGVAVDGSGNVYVADYGNGAVKKIPVGGGAPVILGSGFSHPAGVAVDGFGNVYIADAGNNTVKKIPVGSNTPVILGSGFITPHGIAVDGTGNIFVGDYGNNAIKEIPAGGGAPIIVGAGFSHPVGIAVDGADNIYVTDYGNNAVKQVKPVGGYYISPALPAGLSFSNATGIISATPAVANPATNYTITAYNSNGSRSAVLNITVNPSPVPVISYNGPQTYSTTVAISPLAPNSSAVAAPGYNANPVIVGSGFSSPTSVAADAAGNVYVADEGHKLVKKIPVGGGSPVTLGSGFVTPYGIAADNSGNVYVADYGSNSVKEIPASNGPVITLGSGFLSPTGVAVDVSGNVYVADYGNNAVKKIPAGNGSVITLGSGFSHPADVAVDASGNVYVADYGNSAIKKIPAGGGAPVVIGSGFITPHGVAVDNSGNVFVADYGNNAVKEIPVGGGAPVALGAGFSHPVGIAADGAGNVYVADFGNNAVKQIKPAGGYYISTALPAGLSFSNNTGVISGTPVSISPASNYTITAWNSFGSNSATLNIKVVSGNAKLANLTISAGTLTPAFATATTGYTATVTNVTTSITVTPTTGDAAATVKVNGTAVTSGTASGSIALAVGPNTITTVVTAPDGITTDTYTLTVTRNVPGMDGFYQPISVVKPTDNPTIEDDGIVVHQGVSPNGDGINDVFTIDGLTNYPNNKVTIMNRNGAVIYAAKGYDNSSRVFDGHSNINGAMQLPGTYFYLLEYQVGNDVKRKTGFVILKY